MKSTYFAVLALAAMGTVHAATYSITTSLSDIVAGSNRIFNIEWRATYFGQPGTTNFEVRLYEGQTRFDVIYRNPADNGASATAGVQLNAGDFTQYSFNQGVLTSRLQLTYDSVPEPSTLSMLPLGAGLLLAARRMLKRRG